MNSQALPFALAAVGALQKVVQPLSRSEQTPGLLPGQRPGGVEPFLATLGPLLVDVEARLKEIHDAGCTRGSSEEKRILKLLAVLETLIRWPGALKPPPTTPFRRDNYPDLGRLTKGILQTAKANLRKLATSNHQRAPAERIKFQKSFKAFANTSKHSRGPPLSDLTTAIATPAGYEEYSACLCLLYATLKNCTLRADTSCDGRFTANVALTRMQRLDDGTGQVSVNFFFLHRHVDSMGGMWKEVCVRVILQSKNSTSPKVSFSSTGCISPKDFCHLIRHPGRGRLILSASQAGLVYEEPELNIDQLQRLYLIKASAVSLATVLERRKLDGDSQLKLLLSYLLAKAVWQFYNSDWMAQTWTKHTIHFMRERRNDDSPVSSQNILTLIHKPYFATELGPPPPSPPPLSPTSSGKTSEEMDFMRRFPLATHRHPKILALGIMLLEIELGEGIEKHREDEPLDNGNPIENDDHYTAGKIISSPIWAKRDAFQAVKAIIEMCLKPDVSKFGADNTETRANLYTFVVAPLRKLFQQAWSHDQDPESFSPEPILFNEAEIPTNDLETLASDKNADASSGIEEDHILENSYAMQQPSVVHRENMKIPDTESAKDSILTRQSHADRWFSDFQVLLRKHGLLGRSAQKRIKVAVLDTGIDCRGPDFTCEDRDRIKETVSFLDGVPSLDSDGHGTHIAAIILRLSKSIDLYIGKIADSSIGKNRTVSGLNERERIAEALKHARENWKVDMISLSFGFQTVMAPDYMGTEISNCLHSSIIVFASASNDGGEGCRTYPAKYTGVICAHSASHQGNRSEFNPCLEDGFNFSFVGEYVRPIWPAKMARSDTTLRHRSGTSYATPVAVCIAAFMIDYTRKKVPGYEWVVKPWSPEGMSKIFKLMAVKVDGYDWVSPTRYMKYTMEEKVLADLKQCLR